MKAYRMVTPPNADDGAVGARIVASVIAEIRDRNRTRRRRSIYHRAGRIEGKQKRARKGGSDAEG